PGDVILLVAGPEFNKRIESTDFYFTSEHSKIVQTNEDIREGWYAVLLLGMMVALVTLDFLPMISAMSIIVILFILFKLLSPR
ncbi:hypothetical protein R0J90_20325, partial [Micrococcus sp. SIMBA_144]